MTDFTSATCRAARGLVNMTQQELALAARVGLSTVKAFEVGRTVPMMNNLVALKAALEAAGVEFIPENGGGAGVRMRHRCGAAHFECSELKSGDWQVTVTISGEVQQNVPGFDDEAGAQSWIDRDSPAWLAKYRAGRTKRAGDLG